MNIKIIIGVFILIIGVIGAYLFFTANTTETKSLSGTQFFFEDAITDNDVVIHVTDNGFEPSEIDIAKGQRVVWINDTSAYTWPASNIHPTHSIYSEFDPKEPFAPKEVWSFIFDKVGTWRFHDHLKPSKGGIVEVRE